MTANFTASRAELKNLMGWRNKSNSEKNTSHDLKFQGR
jgi:hypothetical protein